jgi:hypothetical protein
MKNMKKPVAKVVPKVYCTKSKQINVFDTKDKNND